MDKGKGDGLKTGAAGDFRSDASREYSWVKALFIRIPALFGEGISKIQPFLLRKRIGGKKRVKIREELQGL